MHDCIKHHYHCTAYLHIFSRQFSHIIIHQYCFSAPLITSIYIYAFDQNKEKKVIVNNQKKPSFHPNNLFMHLKRLEDTRFRHLWYFPWRFLNFECTIRILDIQNKSEIIQQNLFVHSEFHQTLYLSLSLSLSVLWNSLPLTQLLRGSVSAVGLWRTLQWMIGSNEFHLIRFILTSLLVG